MKANYCSHKNHKQKKKIYNRCVWLEVLLFVKIVGIIIQWVFSCLHLKNVQMHYWLMMMKCDNFF